MLTILDSKKETKLQISDICTEEPMGRDVKGILVIS